MKKNEKGFSLVEGLLILLVVGVIGGLGWYVLRVKEKAPAANIPDTAEQKSFDCDSKFTFEYREPLKATMTDSDPSQCLVSNVTTEEMPPIGPSLPEQLALFFNAYDTDLATNKGFLTYYTRPVKDACCSLELRSQEKLTLDNGKSAILAKIYGGHPIEHEFYFFVYVRNGVAVTTSFPTNSEHKDTALEILRSIR